MGTVNTFLRDNRQAMTARKMGTRVKRGKYSWWLWAALFIGIYILVDWIPVFTTSYNRRRIESMVQRQSDWALLQKDLRREGFHIATPFGGSEIGSYAKVMVWKREPSFLPRFGKEKRLLFAIPTIRVDINMTSTVTGMTYREYRGSLEEMFPTVCSE